MRFLISNKQSNRATAQREGGSVLLVALIAVVLVSMRPISLAAPIAADVTVGVDVPAGCPASDQRFTPMSNNAADFRAYFSSTGAQTWDGWISGTNLEDAKSDAAQLLTSNDDYGFAFIEDTRTGKVVWTSWAGNPATNRTSTNSSPRCTSPVIRDTYVKSGVA